MLYKTFQSDFDKYVDACPTYRIGWNLCLVQPPREYGATYNAIPSCAGDHPIWAVWTDDSKSRGGTDETDVNAIYVMGRTAVAGALRGHCPGIPSVGVYGQWSVHISKFDGTTGKLIWADHTAYKGIDFDFLWRDFYFGDDSGRVWAHQGYGSYSVMRFRQFDTTDTPWMNDKGRSLGMPTLASGIGDYQLDMVIPDNSYLNFAGDGSAFALGGYKRNTVLNVSVPGDWIAMSYNGSTAGDDVTDTFFKRSAHVVHVHNLTTRRRLGMVRTKGRPYKGTSIDAVTLYVFTSQGTIEVINVQTFTNLGVLHYQDFTGAQSSWYFGNDLAICMDKNFRRLLTFQRRPNEEVTGRCKMFVEGWAPIEVAERLMKPIPLEVPQEGKTIKVLTRAYGWGGLGTAGVEIAASITAGSGVVNERITTNNNGYGDILWTCGDEGVDIESIQLTSEVDRAAGGLNDPETSPTVYPAPKSISDLSQEDIFFPGYWISVPYSQRGTGTVSAAIDGYLDDYDEEDEVRNLNFQGAIVEYTWDEIETSFGNYNTSKILTDVNYLAGYNLKTIISITEVGLLSDGGAVPSYITGGEPTVYGSGLTAGFDAGVFLAKNRTAADPADDKVVPRLSNISVRGRYSALISEISLQFLENDNVVGLSPFSATFLEGYNDMRAASGPGVDEISMSSWYEARRQLLETAKSGGKIVFDWSGHSNEATQQHWGDWSSHASWCSKNQVGLMRPLYLLDNYNYHGFGGTTLYPGFGAAVPTAVVLPAAEFNNPRNLNCDDPAVQANLREMLVGTFNEDQTCTGWNNNQKYGVEQYPPWMVAIELSSGIWDVDENSAMTVVDDTRLTLEAKYNR